MVKVRIKVMVLCAIITMVMGLPLTAQTVYEDLGPRESNSLQATAGIFGNDIDDYMSYTGYSGVDFEKMFSYIGGGNEGGGKLQAGLARRFGPLYLGVWYQGNVVRIDKNDNGISDTELIPTWDTSRRVILETEEITAYYENWIESANQIELLVGIAGQGIRLGFYESLSNNLNKGFASGPRLIEDTDSASPTYGTMIDNPNFRPQTITDYKNGTKYYQNATDEYRQSMGYLRPYLGWGTSIPLGGMTIRPSVDLGITFYDDTSIDNHSNYTSVNGKKINIKRTVGDGHINNYMMPFAKIGTEVDLAGAEGVESTIGLSYGIGIKMFSNDISPSSVNKTMKGTVGWSAATNEVTEYLDYTDTKTDATLNVNEQTAIGHNIDLAYTITKAFDDRLSLGFSVGIPLWFGTETNDRYTEVYLVGKLEHKAGNKYDSTTTTTSTITYNGADETNFFGCGLDLAIGARYNLIADRFTVNAGISASPFNVARAVTRDVPKSVISVTTTKEVDQEGNIRQDSKVIDAAADLTDKVNVEDTWEQFSGAIHGGFMLFFSPTVALDMQVNVPMQSKSNFQAEAATVNVMLTVKF